MSNYHSYFIAGPENISPSHMMGNENKEQALVRIVKTLALNGLNVFQLRAKNLLDNEIMKLLYDLKSSMKDTNTKLCINDNVHVASQTKDIIDIVHLGQSDMHPDIARNLIGNNVEIAGGSGVIKDIPDNSKVMGYPAKNIRKFLKENK